MSQNTDTVIALTIGIDTGKNTLHLIGLDDQRSSRFAREGSSGRIAARLANLPRCLSASKLAWRHTYRGA